MKKRILSILLCLTTVLTVFPMIQLSVAAAAGTDTLEFTLIDQWDTWSSAFVEVKVNDQITELTITADDNVEANKEGDVTKIVKTMEIPSDAALMIKWNKDRCTAPGDLGECSVIIKLNGEEVVNKGYGSLRDNVTLYGKFPPVNLKGEGTAESPYLITSVEDMNTWAAAVKSGNALSGKYFHLNADLDISTMVAAGEDHLIAKIENAVFDGGNHTLSGGTQPLFWDIDNSTVKNLKLANFNILADNGSDEGRACLGVWAYNNSVIQNVHVSASQINIPNDQHNHGDAFIVGSFRGTMSECSVVGCTLSAAKGHAPWGHGAGILVGCSGCTDAAGDDPTITNCYVMGNTIMAPSATDAGFGMIAGVFRGTMTNCWASGALWSNAANGFPSGGLIGKSFGVAYGNFMLAPYTLFVGPGANPATSEDNNQHGMLVGTLKNTEGGQMWNGEVRNPIGNYAVAPFDGHNDFNGYQHTATMGEATLKNANGAQITLEEAQQAATYTSKGWSEDVWDLSFTTLSTQGGNGSSMPLTTVYLPELKVKSAATVELPEPVPPVEWQGDGTEATPYLISNQEELMLLSERTNAGNNYANTYFQITADIAVPAEFATIPEFAGTLDGGNYTLSGATKTIIRETNGATVKNLKISGSALTIDTAGTDGHAALISVASNGLTLTNVHASACSVTVNDTFQEIGILVGHLNEGSDAPFNVTLCTVSTSTITIGAGKSNPGWNHGGAGMLFGCGHKSNEGSDVIANCYVRDCNIFAQSNSTRTGVGLIAGRNQNFNIQNCWAYGSVWANASTNESDAAGGLVGSLIGGELSNCFYFQSPTNDRHVAVLSGVGGRLVGVMEWAKVNNCYAGVGTDFITSAGTSLCEDGVASGEAQDKTSTNPARHGQTLAEGAQTAKATYTDLGWDQYIWNLDCTDGYPELRAVDGTTYVPPVIGDADGDTTVTSVDVTYMLRALAGWNGYTLSAETADLNGDGKANNKDATILMRHLAGWAGYETLPIAGK